MLPATLESSSAAPIVYPAPLIVIVLPDTSIGDFISTLAVNVILSFVAALLTAATKSSPVATSISAALLVPGTKSSAATVSYTHLAMFTSSTRMFIPMQAATIINISATRCV